MSFKIASFFSGAGGLDLGFHKAGFEIVWANEFDKKVTPTLKRNFPKTIVDDRSITFVTPEDVPDVDGIIGGPPCQSWSEAGAQRGLDDARGQVFLDYIRLIKAKKPKFFLAENVSGMLSVTHERAFNFLISEMESLGYHFKYKLLNAADYGVPEDRLRVIFVGYHKDLGIEFEFPPPLEQKFTLKDSIWDLRKSAVPAGPGNRTNGNRLKVPNHEYMTGGFSTIYMSRNRVRGWDEQSFTIQAGARHAPIHPQAPKMVKIAPNEQIFAPGSESRYRRLTVREAARIQTFPDDFEFVYENISDGYKMVGNAVAVEFARAIAQVIFKDLNSVPHRKK
jgi:DNA (cytosine-5)-methyltransferase 1